MISSNQSVFYCVSIILIFLINVCSSQGNINNIKNAESPIIDFDVISSNRKKNPDKDCCDDVMTINSALYPEGYLKAPPIYDTMNEQRNSKRIIECLYKFYGSPGERIQLFYEDVDLYFPFDIYKFNKIDCRYADSLCLKFYETLPFNTVVDDPKVKFESITLENHNYDLCNCINVSYTPRQIMSASHFLQIRFKTVARSYESSAASIHSRKSYRGYLIRYRFTKDNGLDNILEAQTTIGTSNSTGCKLYFRSSEKRSGYFSSPNYPGLYPRDIECHYYFLGQKNEKVQITFHTFDVEGIDQCTSETKSDYVELSNFQNRDRFYSRFCGVNKPGQVVSDSAFFHVTFYSNNVFDAKGFQASFYFVSQDSKKGSNKNAASVIASDSFKNKQNKSNSHKAERNLILITINIFLIFIRLKFK